MLIKEHKVRARSSVPLRLTAPAMLSNFQWTPLQSRNSMLILAFKIRPANEQLDHNLDATRALEAKNSF